MKIIKMEHTLAVKDGDILISGTASKAVVGTYKGYIIVTMADSNGVETTFIEKDFAKKLAEALLEKAK